MVVESFMYARRGTGSAAFRRAARWDEKGEENNADFSFAGTGAARLPGYFWLRASDDNGGGGRSLVIGTLHTAFSDAETRRRQFAALKSLLPSEPLDCSRCVFTLRGDCNSDAVNTKDMSRATSFAQTASGMQLERELEARCRFVNVSKHQEGTSVRGTHHDECFVQADAVGMRHAHVYPKYPRFKAMAASGAAAAVSAGSRKKKKERGTAAEVAAPEVARDPQLWDPVEIYTPLELRPGKGEIRDCLWIFQSQVFTNHLLLFVDVSFIASTPPGQQPPSFRRRGRDQPP